MFTDDNMDYNKSAERRYEEINKSWRSSYYHSHQIREYGSNDAITCIEYQ